MNVIMAIITSSNGISK